MNIPFVDLKPQYNQIKSESTQRIAQLLARGDFILGKEVGKFEQEFADYCQVKYAVGLNSGTDALSLSLLTLGVNKGDEVLVPAFTFIATALAVSCAQAMPVFVDVDEKTYNIDVNCIKKAITKKTRAIMPVHIFGQSADMGPIRKIADKYGLKVIEDAAQAHGAVYRDSTRTGSRAKRVGSLGDVACFSFYPTKNLGAFGDGGMVVTNNKKAFSYLRMLRNVGRSSHNIYPVKGYNSRLDTIQAVVLRLKLQHLDKWNQMRRVNAKIYTELLQNNPHITCPYEAAYAKHIYHLYALQVKKRDALFAYLHKNGVGASIYYPIPLHLQKAYKDLGYKKGDFPVAEKITKRIISLPMHPFLKRHQIQYVSKKVLQFFN